MAELYTYKLQQIAEIDGDTVKASIDLGFNVIMADVHIRIYGIDCPEKATIEGKAARAFTRDWIDQHWLRQEKAVYVTVQSHKRDKYGRILGTVFTDGSTLADELKSNHHAVEYFGGKKPQ